MQDDFVGCQIHEEVCSDSEFKLAVFSSPAAMTGLLWSGSCGSFTQFLPSLTFEAS